MKRFLSFIMLTLLLVLASCGKSNHVVITDESGNEVKVEIKNSKEAKDIKNALTYAKMASYEEIDYFDVEAALKLDMRANDTYRALVDLGASAQFDKEKNIALMAHASWDSYLDTGENITNDASSYEVSLYDLNGIVDPYLYIAYKEVTAGSNVADTKIKINGIELVNEIQKLLGMAIPTPESSLMAEIEFEYTEQTPEEMLTAFYANYPKSTIEVTNLNEETFDIKVLLSFNDVMVNATKAADIPVSFPKKDAFIDITYRVTLKTARPILLDFSFDSAILWDYFNSFAPNDEEKIPLDNEKFMFNLRLEGIFKTTGTVNSLKKSEREQYVLKSIKDLMPKEEAPNPEPDTTL